MLRRRTLTRAMAAGFAAPLSALTPAARGFELPKAAPNLPIARDESFWAEVGAHYPRTEGILNLEHGYWGQMARPVETAYLDALKRINRQTSYYARRDYATDEHHAIQQIADTLGAQPDEIVITRNATEAAYNLIRQYRGFQPGDAVLLADIDYPKFKTHMRWLHSHRDVRLVEINLPPRVSQAELLERYIATFDANPDLRLMLLTHASNQHGLVLPVAAITDAARSRGIDVICDAAQSWGLLDFRIDDLKVDYAAFNLHKWIGAPLGTGVLYMRRGRQDKFARHPGESESTRDDARSRVHPGTINFAARLTIPAALEFHRAVGADAKEARLRYLRHLWTEPALAMPHLEVLGGADEVSWSGIGSFRIRGKSSRDDAIALQKRLQDEFGIFSVIRTGLASGACVRITPQVYNTPDELARLVKALGKLG